MNPMMPMPMVASRIRSLGPYGLGSASSVAAAELERVTPARSRHDRRKGGSEGRRLEKGPT